MERRRLGRAEVELSRVVLGCGNFGGIGSAPELFGAGESRDEAFALMDAAWELGITTFDTADAYGGGSSENWIGQWMHARGRRPTIVTKTYNPMRAGDDHGLSRERIERQVASSLDRLGAEHVEAYLAHEFDPETPLEETLGTFEALVERGLVGAYGVSNFGAEELRAALAAGRPAVVQNSYSLLERADEEGVLPLCREHGLAYMAFGPLAGGWLTGKYRRDEPAPVGSRMATRPEPYLHLRREPIFAALDRFAEAAAARGVDTATLAVAWLVAQPDVTAVVVGPRRPEHLDAAMRALEVRLRTDEAEALAAIFARDAAAPGSSRT
jgi:aryl-alcohol dehydrogenase-like predicted oxidoreductase